LEKFSRLPLLLLINGMIFRLTFLQLCFVRAAALLPFNSPFVGALCAGPDPGFGLGKNSAEFSWRHNFPVVSHNYATASDISQVAVSSDFGILYAKIVDGNVSAWRLSHPPSLAPSALLWTRDIGGCTPYFSPTLTGGDSTLLVACTRYSGDFTPSTMYALDARTGALRWNFTAPGSFISPPVVGNDGAIFTTVKDSGLLALEANGSQRFPIGTFFESSGVPPALSPDGKTVYVTGSSHSQDVGNGRLFAVSAATGAPLAAFNATTTIGGTPAVALDGTIIVGLECELISLWFSVRPRTLLSHHPPQHKPLFIIRKLTF
jgi:outer membrane protein assembly factor BamB